MKLRPVDMGKIIKEPGQLKPYKIPPGFTLLVDTREQLPLFTAKDHPVGLRVIRATVHNGDYTILGLEDKFAIERKQVSDFFGYCGKERKRTVAKMERFREMIQCGGWVGLVIEATEADLLSGYYRSTLSAEVIRMALVSFETRYSVHIYYSRSRSDISRYVLDRAIKYYSIFKEAQQNES